MWLQCGHVSSRCHSTALRWWKSELWSYLLYSLLNSLIKTRFITTYDIFLKYKGLSRPSNIICSCVSSGGPRLERRCVRLPGADDVEDQGGCKGQKMTSDPSAPLSAARLPAFMFVSRKSEVQEACTCSQRVSLVERSEQREVFISKVWYLLFLKSNRRRNWQCFHLFVFQFLTMLVSKYFCYLSGVF